MGVPGSLSDARAEVTERLAEVFRTTFGDEAIVLTAEMTADDVEAWDSMTHITLIYAVEDEFGIKLSTRDLEGFRCVGDLVETLTRRL
jgi:acyl carrier protein